MKNSIRLTTKGFTAGEKNDTSGERLPDPTAARYTGGLLLC